MPPIKNKITQYFLKEKEVIGVEIIQHYNHIYVNNIVSLKLLKNNIIVVDSKIETENFDDLKVLTQPEKPIYLIISLRNILHKVVDSHMNTSDEELIREIFPNATLNDFYIQKENIESGKIISIIRRDLLDNIIQDFTSKGIDIIGVSLGGFDVKYIKSLIPNQNTICTKTHQIEFSSNQKIVGITKNNERVFNNVKIGNDELDSRLLISYAGAFKTLLQIPSTFNPSILKEISGEYLQKKIYQSSSIVALISIFMILIISTSANYYYKDETNKMSMSLAALNTDFASLDSLKKLVTQQKKFVKQTNINKGSRTSFYADRLAASVPVGLEFTDLQIFPLQGNKKDYRDNQLMKFQNEVITVKGTCDNSITYNEWIKKLQALEWVKSAMHIDYKDINSSLGEFELKIIVEPSKSF